MSSATVPRRRRRSRCTVHRDQVSLEQLRDARHAAAAIWIAATIPDASHMRQIWEELDQIGDIAYNALTRLGVDPETPPAFVAEWLEQVTAP